MNKDEIVVNCKEKSPDEQCILEDNIGWIGCHYKDEDGDKSTEEDYSFDFIDKLEPHIQRAVRNLLNNIISNRKCEFRHSDSQLYLSSRK